MSLGGGGEGGGGTMGAGVGGLGGGEAGWGWGGGVWGLRTVDFCGCCRVHTAGPRFSRGVGDALPFLSPSSPVPLYLPSPSLLSLFTL